MPLESSCHWLGGDCGGLPLAARATAAEEAPSIVSRLSHFWLAHSQLTALVLLPAAAGCAPHSQTAPPPSTLYHCKPLYIPIPLPSRCPCLSPHQTLTSATAHKEHQINKTQKPQTDQNRAPPTRRAHSGSLKRASSQRPLPAPPPPQMMEPKGAAAAPRRPPWPLGASAQMPSPPPSSPLRRLLLRPPSCEAPPPWPPRRPG